MMIYLSELPNLFLSCIFNYFQFIIGIITVILTLLTFLLARKVHYEFSRNHAKSKQVENMSDLVEFLNSTKIELRFIQCQSPGGPISEVPNLEFNIFEIGDLLQNKSINYWSEPTNFKEYDDCKVFISFESDKFIDIKRFIDNPFIPRKIADRLLAFFVIETRTLTLDDLVNSSIVVINSSSQEMKYDFFKEANCEAMKSWLNLKTHSNSLALEIARWFLSKGIDDFNLRVDFKNVKKS